jgi:hypothetical protein
MQVGKEQIIKLRVYQFSLRVSDDKDNAFESMAMADERGTDKETHTAWCRKWRFLGGGDLEARAVSAVTASRL